MDRFRTTANVILTFDNPLTTTSNGQLIYDAKINVGYPAVAGDMQRFEIDVVQAVLWPAVLKHGHDLEDLVKISLCYDSSPEDDQFQKALEFLIRNGSKYYFQPNQRDETEQAIVDALGIAGNTADH